MQELKLDISGMTCGHCVGAVRSALTSVRGVDVQEVRVGTATVKYDPTQVTASEVERAVTDAGYEAVAKK